MPRHCDQLSCSVQEDLSQSQPLHKNCVVATKPLNTIKSALPVVLTILGMASSSLVTAMVTTSPSSSTIKLVNRARFLHQQRVGAVSDDSLLRDSQAGELLDSIFPARKTKEPAPWTEALFDDMTYVVGDEVSEVQELQRSTGSEIPSEELQRQIEEGKVKPEAFLDAHVQDASQLEKVAMSSVPEQLPRPAVEALTKRPLLHKRKISAAARENSKKQKKGLDYARVRVSHQEELELARQIQKGVALHKLKTDFETEHGREITRQEWTELASLDSPKELRRQVLDYRRAKQLLVEANMGLVHTVVRAQYSHRKSSLMGITQEELIQEGSLGLLRAAELFDPSRGLRFSTYATIWIKGMLTNSHLVEPITLPQREKTKWNKICKTHDELVDELNGSRDPTLKEISTRLGMSVEEVMATQRKMTQTKQVLSLDYEYKLQSRSGDESGGGINLQNDKAFMADVDLAEQTQLRADVVAALAQNLDSREARLMRLRYGLSDGQTRSLSQCADAMGLSQSRVQQLARVCLKKLREAQTAESLQEYLLTIA